MGRKTILDDDLIKKFVKKIGTGVRRSSAGALAGISEASIYNWINKALEAQKECQESDTPKEEHQNYIFIKFLEELDMAEAELEERLIKEVWDEPQGPRWLLGHSPRFRKAYGNSIEVNVHGEGDPIQYELEWPDKEVKKLVSGGNNEDEIIELEDKNP